MFSGGLERIWPAIQEIIVIDKQKIEYDNELLELAQKELDQEREKKQKILDKEREEERIRNKKYDIYRMKCKIQIYEYLEQFELDQDQLLRIAEWISKTGGYENYWSYHQRNVLPPIEEQLNNSPDLYEVYKEHYLDVEYIRSGSFDLEWKKFKLAFDEWLTDSLGWIIIIGIIVIVFAVSYFLTWCASIIEGA